MTTEERGGPPHDGTEERRPPHDGERKVYNPRPIWYNVSVSKKDINQNNKEKVKTLAW
jgi:hypothetical protein